MKKVEFKGTNPLGEKQKMESSSFPTPLQYDSKKKPRSYLPTHQNRDKLSQPQQNNVGGGVKQPVYLPKQKKPSKLVVNELLDDSDCNCNCNSDDDCSSDCQCAKNLIPIQQPKITQERRRRRKKDKTSYFEQSVLDIHRLRRINFVYDSSDCSDSYSSYESDTQDRTIMNMPYTTTQVPPVINPYIDQIPIQMPQEDNTLQPSKRQNTRQSRVKTESAINNTNYQSKQPQIKVYKQPVPQEEWALYQTPDIVHPQRLTKPSLKVSQPGPTKPLYRKPKERIKPTPSKGPSTTPGQYQNPPIGSPKIKGKQPKQKQIGESSSDCDCLCECEC